MELQLRQEEINRFETLLDTVLYQEETTEVIVPDACPDIFQILDGEGMIFLDRKEAIDGRAEFSGRIKINVLYLPDGADGPRFMEAMLPFACSAEAQELKRRSRVTAVPQLQKVDIRLLNPRKVLIRVNYSMQVCGYTMVPLSLSSGAEDPEAYGLCQRVEQYQSYQVTAVQEKTFRYTDDLTLPSGRMDVKEVIRVRAETISEESKIIGKKLVFKGEVRLTLLYRGVDDSLQTNAFTLPYSQLMDVDDAGEEAACQLSLLFTDVKCESMAGDGRTFSVELELLAQAVLRETGEHSLLTDAYSILYEAAPVQKVYPVSLLTDRNSAQEVVRQVLETGTAPDSILDVQLRPSRQSQTREGAELVLTVEVEAFLLYAADQRGFSSVHRTFSVVHRVQVAESSACRMTYSIAKDITAVPSGDGVEVSFLMEFSWEITEQRKVAGIEKITLNSEKKLDLTQRPSVVVRTVHEGEVLWEIAKAYFSTSEEIAQANELPDQAIYPGQLLLIPKMR